MAIRQLNVVVADTFASRLRGLAWRNADEFYPLLFPRCRSLHTFGMRAPIDIVWLESGDDGVARVLAIVPAVGPRRVVRAPRGTARRRTAALELAGGDANRLGLELGSLVAATRR
jgi:uncharacterized protein